MDELERDIRIVERRIDRHDDHMDLIAFYGSSTIRLWSTMKPDLAPLNVINLGFGGSHFDACIYYFNRVFRSLSPSKIVLYGGDNDLEQGYDEHQINERFKEICLMIRERYEDVPLYGITIKPSPHREDKLETIVKANELMNQTIESMGPGTQINTFAALLGPDGGCRPELYMPDGLHLNPSGYQVWSAAIRELLI
jgi:hypothetical protein